MTNAICRITDLYEEECPHCAEKRAEHQRLQQISQNPLADEEQR